VHRVALATSRRREPPSRRPAHISTAYAKALTSGHRQGRGGLSPRTVTHMHRVLREALQQALRWQLLARNPADAVKPPKVERMNVLDTDATAALIEAARPYRIFVPILLGVLCGLRRGEIAALRWKSVDLEAGQLRVVASIEQTKAGCREKETKSGRDRVVALPAMLIPSSVAIVPSRRRNCFRSASGSPIIVMS